MRQESVRGGKTISGASVGILMLASRFPRIHGDGGNAATWPFPMLYRVVRDATPQRVVLQKAEGLLDAFIEAGRDLVADGVDGITTNCGFLALYQNELAQACQVPVASSSLLQAGWVQSLLPPGKRVGILTVSGASLTPDHLRAVGVPTDIPIQGTESGAEFSRVLLGDELELDVAKARADILQAGETLLSRHPEVGALVLECTNMSPYSAELSEVLRLPVYDFYSFVCWFQAGLQPRRFSQTV